MKKILPIFLIIPVVLFCGFMWKSGPIILLSSNPITNYTAHVKENHFDTYSRIYFALYAKDGFKRPGIRMQLSKQEDKVSNWGFTVIMSKDFYIDTSEKVYSDNLYLYRPGHYILQFFYLDNKDYPFAHREFRVH